MYDLWQKLNQPYPESNKAKTTKFMIKFSVVQPDNSHCRVACENGITRPEMRHFQRDTILRADKGNATVIMDTADCRVVRVSMLSHGRVALLYAHPASDQLRGISLATL